MKESPILMSAPMVRAILDGKKVQTRRVIKPQPAYGCEYHINGNKNAALHVATEPFRAGQFDRCWVPPTGRHKDHVLRCPFGGPGSRLWVKETCVMSTPHFCDRDSDLYNVVDRDGNGRICQYLATSPDTTTPVVDYKLKVTPSIHMPRWASRLTLEILDVGVERINDISGTDAVAEGVTETKFWKPKEVDGKEFEEKMWDDFHFWNNYPQTAFKSLWEHLNGKGSWEENPWVWKITFKRID